MLEVELKFRLPDAGVLIPRLLQLGGIELEPVHQLDQYFNHPVRDFSQTDEAVRIRQSNGGSAWTYKGPLVDRETKTRREIEIDLSGANAGEQMAECLTILGFRPVHVVEKQRRRWRLTYGGREVEAAIDDVVGLGQFVELETAAPEAELSEARGAIQSLAAELGLRQGERKGYLTLLLETKHRTDCDGTL